MELPSLMLSPAGKQVPETDFIIPNSATSFFNLSRRSAGPSPNKPEFKNENLENNVYTVK